MATRAVTVTTAGVTLAEWNPRRTSLAIWNNGTETCFWGNDRGGSAAQGFPIPTGVPTVFAKLTGDDPRMPVYAFAATVDNNFRVYEAFEGEQ